LIFLFIPLFLIGGIIEDKITKIYKTTYPTIKIDKIILKNNNHKITNIDTSLINPKRASGSIKVGNYFVFYKIDATIKVLKSSKIINKNEAINNYNSTLQTIKFKNFYSYPLTTYPHKIAKFYIPKNKIIYGYMVTTPNTINRGENINVISKSGGIEISFEAIALQNGKVGDKIKVKKDKQILFVTIDKNGNGRL